jgi:hypothetical protein
MPHKLDRDAYYRGREMTLDCSGGEVVIGTKSAAAEVLITKGALTSQQVVDTVFARAGLPTRAQMQEAAALIDEANRQLAAYKSQKYWENFWKYQAYS